MKTIFFLCSIFFYFFISHLALATSFSHNDWLVDCDNTLTCRAVGYSPVASTYNENQVNVAVLFTRKAGDHQVELAKVKLELDSDGDRELKTPNITLFINGKKYGGVRTDLKTSDMELSRFQTDALIKALLKTSTIFFKDKTSGFMGNLSDNGATAVFFKMDDIQGRLYTDTAIVRKGKRSHRQLKKSKPIPVIQRAKTLPLSEDEKRYFLLYSDEVVKEIKKGLKKIDDEYECNDIIESGKLNLVDRLSKHKLLVSSSCWMAAYNAGSGYWIINESPPYTPILVTTSANDYSNGLIDEAQKGRGVGDCWSYESFIWNGKSFVLSRRGDTGMCRGFAGGAWELPSYVSKVTKQRNHKN